jgi:hypothetical protein
MAAMRKAGGCGYSLFYSVFSLFSSLYLKTNHLCFSIFPLFFLSIYAPLIWLLSPVGIYREKIGREVYYPYPVMAQG